MGQGMNILPDPYIDELAQRAWHAPIVIHECTSVRPHLEGLKKAIKELRSCGVGYEADDIEADVADIEHFLKDLEQKYRNAQADAQEEGIL